jgi:hypothetical protein
VPLARMYQSDLFNLGTMQSVIKLRLQYTFIPTNHVTDLPTIDPRTWWSKQTPLHIPFNHYLNGLSKQGARRSPCWKWNRHTASPVTCRFQTFTRLRPQTFRRPCQADHDSDKHAFFRQRDIDVYGEGFRTVRNTFTYVQPAIFNTSIAHSYTKDPTNEVLWHLGGKYRDFEGRMHIRYSIKDSSWVDTLYPSRINQVLVIHGHSRNREDQTTRA